MSCSTTIRCDRCDEVVTSGGSIVEVKAGAPRDRAPESWDLCPDCSEDLVAFLRRGEAHRAAHAAPGDVRGPAPGGSEGPAPGTRPG
jgi:hypothetical protein